MSLKSPLLQLLHVVLIAIRNRGGRVTALQTVGHEYVLTYAAGLHAATRIHEDDCLSRCSKLERAEVSHNSVHAEHARYFHLLYQLNLPVLSLAMA